MAGKAKKPNKPELVPQEHGGALLTGGVPGNRGGTKPTSEIRRRLRGSFSERASVLEDIADGKIKLEPTVECPECGWQPDEKQAALSVKVATADVLKAMDMLGKYGGLGPKEGIPADKVQDRLAATIQTIETELAPEDAQRLLDALEPIWR